MKAALEVIDGGKASGRRDFQLSVRDKASEYLDPLKRKPWDQMTDEDREVLRSLIRMKHDIAEAMRFGRIDE